MPKVKAYLLTKAGVYRKKFRWHLGTVMDDGGNNFLQLSNLFKLSPNY